MRHLTRANALVVLLPLAAACSSSRTAAAPQPSASTSVTVVVPASPSASAVAPTSSDGVPVCRIGDVTVKVTARDDLVSSEPGADHEGTVVITSTASHTCSTVGTPGMTLLGDDGKPLQESATDATQQGPASPTAATVVLQPGGQMSFAFERSTSQGGDGFTCSHVSDALVSLPGSADSKPSGVSFTGCDTGHGLPLTIGPLVSGPSARLRA